MFLIDVQTYNDWENLFMFFDWEFPLRVTVIENKRSLRLSTRYSLLCIRFASSDDMLSALLDIKYNCNSQVVNYEY